MEEDCRCNKFKQPPNFAKEWHGLQKQMGHLMYMDFK